MAKKGGYIGFLKLKRELASKPGVNDPGALAASIGRKKYGAKKFNAAAASGRKLAHASSRPRGDGDTRITEDDPRWNPRTMGNHRGSKNSKFGRKDGQYRPT